MTNEKHCGHALCQKSVTLDPLSHKRVRNKNHKPQYFIRNHHDPIISEEDWNATQKELERRRKMLRDPEGKYRSCYSNNAIFSNKLFCGNCGMPANRRRLTSKMNGVPYHFSAWQCRLAAQKTTADFECKEKYVWEEVIEQAYNEMLLNMSLSIEDVQSDGEAAIREVSLTEDESARLEELEGLIDRISDQISDMSMRESVTKNQIYDATMRNLIYEVQIYQQEHENLLKNKEESVYFKKNLNELIETLRNIDDFETFNAEVFKAIIARGILHENYEIEFVFKCGITRMAYGRRRGKSPM
jgi:hypothetical protein